MLFVYILNSSHLVVLEIPQRKQTCKFNQNYIRRKINLKEFVHYKQVFT